METGGKNNLKIIIILGPTSSGKSDFGVALAEKFKGEIISADSRQVYKGLNIGSGKITKKEMRSIPHHLLCVASPKKIFTALDFKKMANKKIQEISEKNKIPFIVGGTGFYIQAITDDILIPEIKSDWKLRKKLEKKTAEKLFKILQKLNPERAKNIDPKNPRRLIRAIEITKALKKKSPSEFLYRRLGRAIREANGVKQFKNSACDFLYLGIKLQEKELKKKIENRIREMIESGLIKETKKLRDSGLSWKRIYELGFEYKYPAMFLQRKISKQEMLEKMILENNHYAKRQMTWFKKYAPDTRWINSSISGQKKAEKLIRGFLK